MVGRLTAGEMTGKVAAAQRRGADFKLVVGIREELEELQTRARVFPTDVVLVLIFPFGVGNARADSDREVAEIEVTEQEPARILDQHGGIDQRWA